MESPEKIGTRQSAVSYRGLRDWLEQVERLGELLKVNGAHWDREMGAITQMLTEGGKGKAPAILFDEVPGYPKGYRTLYGQFSTIKRVALTLGLPLQYERKADIVKAYHHRMTEMKLIKPKVVKTGPIFDNVLEGDKVNVLKLPVPIHHPADAEIVIEGEAVRGQTKPEGPFGEWMGYYSDDVVPRPQINVKTVLYRNNPILTCAPQHKPVDETGLLKGIAGAAEIWKALEACGLPDILGVWNHEGAPATRFTAIQIRQRYPGHARNVLHVAANCMAGAYNGKWTVVVDDDVDCSDMDQVLWAMGTRFDPVTDIDIVQKAWSSGRDPMFLPGNFNNRILIDACIPYNRKLRGEFPKVVEVPEDYRAKMKSKFPQAFKSQS